MRFVHVRSANPACAPDCPDCRRLAQVKRCLLQPFWEKPPAKAMAA